MLRKRSRPVQNQTNSGESMPDKASGAPVAKSRAAAFFTVPGIFVGLSNKNSSDCDSAKSPTSPLDFKVFTLLGSSLARSKGQSPRKWECCRVGLSLVDSLNDEVNPGGNFLGFNGTMFGSHMTIKIPKSNPISKSPRDNNDHEEYTSAEVPKSLPKDYNISSPFRVSDLPKFKLGSGASEIKPEGFGKTSYCSATSGAASLPVALIIHQVGSPLIKGRKVLDTDVLNSNLGSSVCKRGTNSKDVSGSLPIPLSVTDIEESEDYTCIISHGPNPKTTHIFGDCILENHTFGSPSKTSKQVANCDEESPQHPDDDFLSFCFSCKKKLEEGKDIYIYGGEKAFCSYDCRDEAILIEERMEKPISDFCDSANSSFELELF